MSWRAAGGQARNWGGDGRRAAGVEELLGRDSRIVRDSAVMYPALDEFVVQRKA